MARRDPEAIIASKNSELRDQAVELRRLRQLLDTRAAQVDAANTDAERSRRLVRFIVRDHRIDDLDLTVHLGSADDIDQMNHLVDVLGGSDVVIEPTPREMTYGEAEAAFAMAWDRAEGVTVAALSTGSV